MADYFSAVRSARAILLAAALLTATACDLSRLPGSAWIVQTVASFDANFRESRRIIATFEPADLEVYRRALPAPLEMPEHPLVQVHMIDQIDVGPWPLTPYREGSINLRAAHRGEEGWYITSLPVSTWVAEYSGRTMGFPKYRADEVRFEPTGDGAWESAVIHDGRMRLSVRFDPGPWRAPPVAEREGWSLDGPVLNLDPPGEGPGVIRVESRAGGDATAEVEEGLVWTRIGEGEPLRGLVDESAPRPGVLVHIREARSLDPEGT